jgi:threonine aldolase
MPAVSEDLQARREELKSSSRWLHGHGRQTPAKLLERTATWCREHEVAFDVYGTGELIEAFEARVAELLGFEAARFMPSGTMAQPIALRVWAERAHNAHVGMHPTSHLELHEQRGYAHLHGLRSTPVGSAASPLLAEHFEAVKERLAALLIELPIREAGGQLPSWGELETLKQTIREAGTRLHLDGARLWECAAHYGRSYAEICAGFDSCYVSFYKGIGALPGAMLLGPRALIDEATVWQRRSGGNLFTLAPNVASAAMLLDERLARMPAYHQRALEIARVLSAIEGVSVLPDPPHTNMMHVFLALESEAAMTARDRVAETFGLWLLNAVRPADVPGHSRFELYVGEAAMQVGDRDLDAAFRALLAG